jgi:hypothetical protein
MPKQPGGIIGKLERQLGQLEEFAFVSGDILYVMGSHALWSKRRCYGAERRTVREEIMRHRTTGNTRYRQPVQRPT